MVPSSSSAGHPPRAGDAIVRPVPKSPSAVQLPSTAISASLHLPDPAIPSPAIMSPGWPQPESYFSPGTLQFLANPEFPLGSGGSFPGLMGTSGDIEALGAVDGDDGSLRMSPGFGFGGFGMLGGSAGGGSGLTMADSGGFAWGRGKVGLSTMTRIPSNLSQEFSTAGGPLEIGLGSFPSGAKVDLRRGPALAAPTGSRDDKFSPVGHLTDVALDGTIDPLQALSTAMLFANPADQVISDEYRPTARTVLTERSHPSSSSLDDYLDDSVGRLSMSRRNGGGSGSGSGSAASLLGLVMPQPTRPLELSTEPKREAVEIAEASKAEGPATISPDPWMYRPVPVYAGQNVEEWRKTANIGGGSYNPLVGCAFSPSSDSQTQPRFAAESTSPRSNNTDVRSQVTFADVDLLALQHARQKSAIAASGGGGDRPAFAPQDFGDFSRYSTVGSVESVMALCRDDLAAYDASHQAPQAVVRPTTAFPSSSLEASAVVPQQRQGFAPLNKIFIDPAMIDGYGGAVHHHHAAMDTAHSIASPSFTAGGTFDGGLALPLGLPMGAMDLTQLHGSVPIIDAVIPPGGSNLFHGSYSSTRGSGSSTGPDAWARIHNAGFSPGPFSAGAAEDFGSSPEALSEVRTRRGPPSVDVDSARAGNVAGPSKKAPGPARREKVAKGSRAKASTSQRKASMSGPTSEHQVELKRKAAEAIDALQRRQEAEREMQERYRDPPPPAPAPLKMERPDGSVDEENPTGRRGADMDNGEGEGEGEGEGDGDDAMTGGEGPADGEVGPGGKKTKLKRKEMNRVAARRHREKTKERLRSLEDRKNWLETTVREYEGTMKKMQETLFRLQKENEVLRRANFSQNMANCGTRSANPQASTPRGADLSSIGQDAP